MVQNTAAFCVSFLCVMLMKHGQLFMIFLPVIKLCQTSVGLCVPICLKYLLNVAEFLSPPFPEKMLIVGFYHCFQIKRHFRSHLSQTVGLQFVSYDLLPFSSANECDLMQSSQSRTECLATKNIFCRCEWSFRQMV